MEIMSAINKYEITILWNKKEEKHIVNALTAQDAITQFKVKMDNVKPCNIINIEPWVQQWTGEDYMAFVNAQNKIRERIIEQQPKPKPNKVKSFINRILK